MGNFYLLTASLGVATALTTTFASTTSHSLSASNTSPAAAQKTCVAGQYLVSTNGTIYDQYSTSRDYHGDGTYITTSSLQSCLDYCDSLGSSRCLAFVWVPKGLPQPYCYPKTSLVVAPNFPSSIVGFSAVRNTNSTICPGQGTSMLSNGTSTPSNSTSTPSNSTSTPSNSTSTPSNSTKPCEAGQYLTATDGTIYDQFSTTKDYSSAGGATIVTSSMQACLDYCESLGTQCAAVVWVMSGQSNQYCYPKNNTQSGSNLSSTLTAYSAVRNLNTVVCPGQGTSIASTVAKTCTTDRYLLSSNGSVYGQFSATQDYSQGGAAVSTPSMQACLDYCDSLGSKCVAVVWVMSGQAKQFCYPKTSLQLGSGFSSTLTAYSVVKAANATVCSGKGTNVANTVKTFQSGNYLLSSSGAVYDQFSTTQDYLTAGTPKATSSMQACLDYCETLGPAQCAAVTWVGTGLAQQLCYPKLVLLTTSNFSSSVTAFSAVRAKTNIVLCPNMGTNAYFTSLVATLSDSLWIRTSSCSNSNFDGLYMSFATITTGKKTSQNFVGFSAKKPAGAFYIQYSSSSLIQGSTIAYWDDSKYGGSYVTGVAKSVGNNGALLWSWDRTHNLLVLTDQQLGSMSAFLCPNPYADQTVPYFFAPGQTSANYLDQPNCPSCSLTVSRS